VTIRTPHGDLADAVAAIGALGGLDEEAAAAARRHLDSLTKPPGSLGRLEELVTVLAGITGRPDAQVARRTIVVAAADHGVAARGVSAYPADVTAQMVANFVAGGAAISVLARALRASLVVVDAGVASPIPAVVPMPGVRVVSAAIAQGTADFCVAPAMSREQAESAIGLGLRVAREVVDAGVDIVAVGEMGIGNTTSASAVVAALTGLPGAVVTGRGTGVDDAGYERKIVAIELGLRRNPIDAADPVGVLASVGGFEIGVLVGVVLGAVAARRPLVLDGFITGAAALIAATLQPVVAPRLIASHCSVEPGHRHVLDRLGIRPLLDLDLRLGEATGAALALGLLDAAVLIRDEMATFASAGISGPG